MVNKNTEKQLKSINPFPAMEEEVLAFWEKNKIFEKSLERGVKEYVFYDGPPFATGTPHYGHIVASIMKDVVPRYWTMKGFKVERKWGWDCHGLPIENIVERELGFTSKKDIEKLGIAKFNETCRSKVLGYVDEWKKIITRLGRWADMDNAYKTMDKDYMESIWWVFKQLWERGLIYESYRTMHVCPRCETTLSQMEVAEGYKDIKDLAVTVKFKLKNPTNLPARLATQGVAGRQIGYKFTNTDKVYMLAWTTTPWTLPGNVALAVGKDIEYVLVENLELWDEISSHDQTSSKNKKDEYYVLAKDVLSNKGAKEASYDDVYVFQERTLRIVQELKGKDLIGIEYNPPFDYYINDTSLENHANGWKVYAADFVTAEEGTGIAHEAPAFGADDWALLQKENLPFVQHVKMDGTFKDEVVDFKGLHVKPIEDAQATDVEIIKYLAKKDLLFSKEKYPHSYPHCWRCDTPLINYATSSWFVKVTEVKAKALQLAKEINWTPKHIKEGRFGQWLEGARDWSISRQRFWASVMPIWKCHGNVETQNFASLQQGCGTIKVIGSVAELEKLSGQKIDDLHKHIVDDITFPCEQCGGTMKRIPDVLDTWFDSGSMPYAQMHYDFENKEKFEQNFPAEFIAEGVDQTRAWFYYLHVLGTALKNKPAFKNVIVNGIVLAEDGKKMSKRLQNYPDPMEVMEKHGADKLRYYLCSSSVVKAEDLNFSEKDLVEQTRFLNILLNVLNFYKMFAGDVQVENLEEKDLVNVLDKWITARLEETKQIITEKMDSYDLHAVRELPKFIDDLSTWYVRRSRDRFKGDNEVDKTRALKTLRRTLYHTARIMAPFMPFMAEHIYQQLGADVESVHLKEWPKVRKEWIDKQLLVEMEHVKLIVGLSLQERNFHNKKIRQPLPKLTVSGSKLPTSEIDNFKQFQEIILDEINVKEIEFVNIGDTVLTIVLDINITPELIQEGTKRELVRAINNLRKEAGMTIKDRAVIFYQTESKDIQQAFETFGEEIKKDTLADDIQPGEGKIVNINGETVEIRVEKVI